MYRALSLILMPCLLLTQSLSALGHSHGSDEPAGHGLHPHFHVTRSVATESPGHHDHEANGHHHSHDVCSDCDGLKTLASKSIPASQPGPLSDHEHDSDAVYISQVECGLCRHSEVDERLSVSCEWDTPAFCQPVAVCVGPSREIANWRHTRPRGRTCARYISLRTLLI